MTVRKVAVGIELVRSITTLDTGSTVAHRFLKPSPKVAILRFERGMQQGLLGRISRSAVMEYHAFGIVR